MSFFKWVREPIKNFGNIFLVTLEGTVGVGKSELIKRLAKDNLLKQVLHDIIGHNNFFVECLLEPVERWSNGMLEEFYNDKKANAFPFQMQVFMDHVDVIRKCMEPYLQGSGTPTKAGKPVVILMERSMVSQLLFWRQQQQDGFTTRTQETIYTKYWSEWQKLIPEPVLFVLLRIDPKNNDLQKEIRRVQRRVQARNRGEEVKLESRKEIKTSLGNWDESGEPLDQNFMEYNKKLLIKHEKYFTQGNCNPEGLLTKPVACIHCDASRPYHTDDDVLKKVAREIAGYISTHIVLRGYTKKKKKNK